MLLFCSLTAMFSLFDLQGLCRDEDKLRATQGIDGAWGRLKTFLRSRGGIRSEHIESNVKEFQRRTNLASDADPFISLLVAIKHMVVSSDLLLFGLLLCDSPWAGIPRLCQLIIYPLGVKRAPPQSRWGTGVSRHLKSSVVPSDKRVEVSLILF